MLDNCCADYFFNYFRNFILSDILDRKLESSCYLGLTFFF